jgi:hypothetical protein
MSKHSGLSTIALLAMLFVSAPVAAASLSIGTGPGDLVTTSGPTSNPDSSVNLGGPGATNSGDASGSTVFNPSGSGSPNGSGTFRLGGTGPGSGSGTGFSLFGPGSGTGAGTGGNGLGTGTGSNLFGGAGNVQVASLGSANCISPDQTQIANLTGRQYNSGTVSGWSHASNVQIVPVRICQDARARLSQAVAANGNVGFMQRAAASDPLITASLARTRYNIGDVLAVEQAGGVLKVYVY